jgi:pimeloyl-ACP methyl ester carboxylesterase
VHGFAGSTRRTWQDAGWLDLLADSGREVVGIDLPGHGTAPKSDDPASYGDAEQVVAAQLPRPVCDAIGFSAGARLLLVIAADDPGRFRRLVVAGVGANLFRDDPSELLAQALSEASAGDPADPVARYFRSMASADDSDPRALAAWLRRTAPLLDHERLSRITTPVLVVLGDLDFAGPPDPLVEALPNAQLCVLRGVDHFSTPKHFEFIDAALDFLGAED